MLRRIMAKDAATQILNDVWCSRGFPVDPVWIAREFGIRVIEADLPTDVSGALIKDQGQDPIMVLSAADSKNRKRFTAAHELGHFIRRNGQEHYEYVDLRSPASANGKDPEEVFANQFAANLLMPEAAVREQSRSGQPSFMIALHFGVSNEAMGFRLSKLKLSRD